MIVRWLKIFWPESCIIPIDDGSDSRFITVDFLDDFLIPFYSLK